MARVRVRARMTEVTKGLLLSSVVSVTISGTERST